MADILYTIAYKNIKKTDDILNNLSQYQNLSNRESKRNKCYFTLADKRRSIIYKNNGERQEKYLSKTHFPSPYSMRL